MNVAQAAAAVQALLDAANSGTEQVTVFLGEPAPVMDKDGKAHPYNAIFPGSGQRDPADADLTGAHGARSWPFQVKCAGGDVARALRALVRAQNVLVGQRLDDTTGLIRENGDGGQIRKDDTVSPHRWFTDLLLTVDL